MAEDADSEVPAYVPPDADRVYRNYVETCRRLGVEPTPRDRAQNLIKDRNAALVAAGQPPTSSDAIAKLP